MARTYGDENDIETTQQVHSSLIWIIDTTLGDDVGGLALGHICLS